MITENDRGRDIMIQFSYGRKQLLWYRGNLLVAQMDIYTHIIWFRGNNSHFHISLVTDWVHIVLNCSLQCNSDLLEIWWIELRQQKGACLTWTIAMPRPVAEISIDSAVAEGCKSWMKCFGTFSCSSHSRGQKVANKWRGYLIGLQDKGVCGRDGVKIMGFRSSLDIDLHVCIASSRGQSCKLSQSLQGNDCVLRIQKRSQVD